MNIYIYIYVYILHIYIYIFIIYTNLPVDVIVRLSHPRSGDSQGQETFLALYIDLYAHIYTYISQTLTLLSNISLG